MKAAIDLSSLVSVPGRVLPIFLSICVLTLAACATAPLPPTRELQAATQAITSAEQAGVADYAIAELNQAREKLAAANIAVRNEDMVLASRLADESRVNAELAIAKTEMIKARTVNEQMQESINVLTQELLRNTGTR